MTFPKCSAPVSSCIVIDTCGEFAASIIDTDDKFATCINSDTGGKFSADVVDTGGKFAIGVVDTGANLLLVMLILVASLPPVFVDTWGAHDLRISPQILDKTLNDPNVIFRGLGEDD